MQPKKKGHLAIGGKIVGETASETEKPGTEKPKAEETTPPPQIQKRRRIAIGGRLF